MNPEHYAEKISSPAPTYLYELERETHLKMAKPQMLSGFLQGRFLSAISKSLAPVAILEIGTYTGYGSLCLAEGLAPNGKLWTIEINPEHIWLAKKYFEKSPYYNQIETVLGTGLEEVSKLNQTWDLVYIDADKIANMDYFYAIWPRVKSGGWVIIDNTFARGGVWKPKSDQKPFELAVALMNEKLRNLADGNVICLPIRDGITVVIKN